MDGNANKIGDQDNSGGDPFDFQSLADLNGEDGREREINLKDINSREQMMELVHDSKTPKELIDFVLENDGPLEDTYGRIVREGSGYEKSGKLEDLPYVVDLTRTYLNWSAKQSEGLRPSNNVQFSEGGFNSGGFVHFKYEDYDKGFVPSGNSQIEARLYLSPTDENVASMTGMIISKCVDKNKMNFRLKINEKNDRNDKIVLYTDYKNMGNYLGMLEEIKQENPGLFENMGKNRLWGTIDGAPEGVYFGEEPKDHNTSYSRVRTRAIEDGINDWCRGRSEFSRCYAGEVKGKLRNLPEAERQDLEEHLGKYMRDERGIDCDNFCFGG